MEEGSGLWSPDGNHIDSRLYYALGGKGSVERQVVLWNPNVLWHLQSQFNNQGPFSQFHRRRCNPHSQSCSHDQKWSDAAMMKQKKNNPSPSLERVSSQSRTGIKHHPAAPLQFPIRCPHTPSPAFACMRFSHPPAPHHHPQIHHNGRQTPRNATTRAAPGTLYRNWARRYYEIVFHPLLPPQREGARLMETV